MKTHTIKFVATYKVRASSPEALKEAIERIEIEEVNGLSVFGQNEYHIHLIQVKHLKGKRK